eukprot:CCRYP_004015-RA/>CCRYP_004015-RA protein AED:0.32 eAED:0.32 QI:0/0.5/0.66/1/1/1/3/1189/611
MIDDVGVTALTTMAPFGGTCAASHENDNLTSEVIIPVNIAEGEPTSNEGEQDQSNDERRLKRKQSLEAQVTTGCGGGRKKQRIVDAFYETLWPMLEDLGWKIVSARKNTRSNPLIKNIKRHIVSSALPLGTLCAVPRSASDDKTINVGEKVKGEGKDDGAVYFLPPGLTLERTSIHNKESDRHDVASGKKAYTKSDTTSEGEWKCTKCGHLNTERARCKMCLGWKGGSRIQKAYFNKVRDVIERVLKSSDETEAKAAQAYVKVVPDIYDHFFPQESGSTSPNRRIGTRQRHVDIDWKHERKHYPKATSRVGEDYQATELPAMCTSFESKGQNDAYEKLWDWSKAASKAKLEFVHRRVTPNKKVEAYEKLHQRGYVLPGFFQEVCDLPTTNGSNWTDDDRKRFKASIFKEFKNMDRVSRSIGKPMKECLAYYYGTFKQTKDYQKLKAFIQRHKQKTGSPGGSWVCDTCGVGGTLIACDSCEAHYHLTCLIPPLREVPEGSWVCSKCVKTESGASDMKFETDQSDNDNTVQACASSMLKGLSWTVDSSQPAVASLGSISRPKSFQSRENPVENTNKDEIEQSIGCFANSGEVGDENFAGDATSEYAHQDRMRF